MGLIIASAAHQYCVVQYQPVSRLLLIEELEVVKSRVFLMKLLGLVAANRGAHPTP